ncbi:hypothetical protein QBC38DRAFT_543532 [Podospora fimiseda]|uniref:FAD/NAD(P)-binding domain-containing protein n=1 Tax=Podospora fimiseda TaxID=252190 RepID=A0AAN7GXK4_9PEZI|nr:hypothetical protein QBC38DRAFT_543532 [Podospora fimiseda]
MAETLLNVVVVGGSYVGVATVKELLSILPTTHRIILVEPHTHFHHLFAFPRFSILPTHEHKSFIPYTSLFPSSSPHKIIHARATSLSVNPNLLQLDRSIPFSNSTSSTEIPFDYLIAATGTTLSFPGTMPFDSKPASIKSLQSYQEQIARTDSVLIIGGGAVGVQMACDTKEIYPEKKVVLVHSRERVMKGYEKGLDEVIQRRFKELGVDFFGGKRVKIPEGGFTFEEGKEIEVEMQGGKGVLKAGLVVQATGQKPNNGWIVKGLGEGVLNERNGFVRVRKTMQFEGKGYERLFAVGDCNDSGAHKAAKPGMVQGGVAARNVVRLIKGGVEKELEEYEVGRAGIHMTLGLKRHVLFRNPDMAKGETEPFVETKDDGAEDMNIESVWARRGPAVTSPLDYHL